MPSKKKKYNARFPAGRIKKIMQSDEEVGKVAQAVPVIISRTLELFVESLLTKTLRITNSRNAKTLSTSHMKQCIMSENQFDFLRELVKNIPDISVNEEFGNLNDSSMPVSPCFENSPTAIQPQTPITPIQQEPYDLSRPSTSCEYNLKNLTVSPPQHPHVGIVISNGQARPLVRNGNSINTNLQKQQQIFSGIDSTSTLTPSLPSQGIEITCKNSIIAKISIPKVSPDNNAIVNKVTDIDSIGNNDLKRSWDSISRLRNHPPIASMPINTKIQSVTSSSSSSSSSNTNLTSPQNYISSGYNCSPLDSIKLLSPSSIKISRLDSNSVKKETNITISPSKSKEIGNSSTSTSNFSKDVEELKTNADIKSVKPMVFPAPIVNFDKNVCSKPYVKIDYSKLLLPQDDNKNYKNESKENKLNKTSVLTPDISNSPVINIDLSKIATQPPTINFNFNNLITTDNVPKNPNMLSQKTKTGTTLELDEDYDNI